MESDGSNLTRTRGDRPAVVRCKRCGAEVAKLAPGQSARDVPRCPCTVIRRPGPGSAE